MVHNNEIRYMANNPCNQNINNGQDVVSSPMNTLISSVCLCGPVLGDGGL